MAWNFLRGIFGSISGSTRQPANKHWRDEYDDAAEADRRRLDKIPVERLLNEVRSGQYGDYYNIWYSIAERTTVKTAGWILFDTLNKNVDYLYRYHCAAALLSLMKISHVEPVQLSSEGHHCKENINAIRFVLEKTIGQHPGQT